jgi:hypothetical protein
MSSDINLDQMLEQQLAMMKEHTIPHAFNECTVCRYTMQTIQNIENVIAQRKAKK